MACDQAMMRRSGKENEAIDHSRNERGEQRAAAPPPWLSSAIGILSSNLGVTVREGRAATIPRKGEQCLGSSSQGAQNPNLDPTRFTQLTLIMGLLAWIELGSPPFLKLLSHFNILNMNCFVVKNSNSSNYYVFA